VEVRVGGCEYAEHGTEPNTDTEAEAGAESCPGSIVMTARLLLAGHPPNIEGPPRRTPSVPAVAPGGDNCQVWVNTKMRVSHTPGSCWYGKTEEGVYMAGQQAIQ
jgi:hypothetical protein